MKKEKSFDQPIWNNFLSKYMIIQNDGYCCLVQKNIILVSMILILTNLQLTMLFSKKFITKNLKSIFHVRYYRNVVQYYNFHTYFSSRSDEGMILTYILAQVSTIAFFFLIHFLRSRFSFFAFLKTFGLVSMNLLVLMEELLIVPQCDTCAKIFIKNLNGDFGYSIIYPFLSIIIFRVISVIVRYFTQDFKFYSERILSKRNHNVPEVKLIFLIMITIAKNYHLENDRSEFLFLNLIFNLILSIYLLYDEYIEDNYPSSSICSFAYISTLWFFAAETIFYIFSSFNDDFVSVFNIDLLFVSVFWVVIKTFLEMKNKRMFSFMKTDLFTEKDVKIVDRICRILLQYNEDEDSNAFINFILITVIKEHNRTCKEKSCPCWNMVIKKVEKRSKMEMDMIRGIEEDDKVGLPSVIKSKKLREMLEKQRENAPTKIILDSHKISKFVEHIYLERSKVVDENDTILMSTITFLCDISNNHIRCLEKIFYLKQKISKKFKKIMIMQTFKLENLRMILQSKFDKKKFKYSELSFVIDSKHAVGFHLEVEALKNKMVDFSIKLRTFYKMLLKRIIDLKDLYSFIIDLVAMKKKFDKEFARKFKLFRMNKELLINYYYYKHFLLFDDTQLKEYEESLKNCFKYEATYKSGKIRFNNYQNLMSDSYVVILKITDENILIDHVSPNCLDLFEVLHVEDLIGKSINNFMPHTIARVHDSILRNYLNKKNKAIFSDLYFETFLITKQLSLKEIMLSRVIEYSDKNYLYVASVIVTKQTVASRVLTDLNGTILATNEKSNQILKLDHLNKDACIFTYMPQLFWNYYKKESFDSHNKLETITEDSKDLTVFCLQVQRSYNDNDVFEHLITNIYPDMKFETEENDHDDDDRSFIVIFNGLNWNEFLDKVDNIYLTKIKITNYFYSSGDLGLKLVQIHKASLMEEEFFMYFKEKVRANHELPVLCNFYNISVSYMVEKTEYLSKTTDKYFQSSVTDVAAEENQELHEFGRMVTDKTLQMKYNTLLKANYNLLRQTWKSHKVYNQDSENFEYSQKINFIRMLEEKNREISGNSFVGNHGSVGSSQSNFLQSEVRSSIKNTKKVAFLEYRFILVVSIFMVLMASNIFNAVSFNFKTNSFHLFYSEMNDIINIFVPIGFFHLQYSKYFLARDKLGQLGVADFYDKSKISLYYDMYNEEMDKILSRSYIDTLFIEESLDLELVPHDLDIRETLDVVKGTSLAELLFEMNYRLKFFQESIYENGTLNWENFGVVNNDEYLKNFYVVESAGFTLTNHLTKINEEDIETMRLLEILSFTFYGVMALVVSYMIASINRVSTRLLNRTLFLYTRLSKKALKLYQRKLELNTNMMMVVATPTGSRVTNSTNKSRKMKKSMKMGGDEEEDATKKGNSYLFHEVPMPSFNSLILIFVLVFVMIIGGRSVFSYVNYYNVNQGLEAQKKLKILTKGIQTNYISYANIFVYNHLLQYNNEGLKTKVDDSITRMRENFFKQFSIVFENQNPEIGSSHLTSGIVSVRAQDQNFDLMMTENFCSVLTILDPEDKSRCNSLTVESPNANLKIVKIYISEFVDNMLKSNQNFTSVEYLFSQNTKNNEEILEFLQRAITSLFKSNLDVLNSHITTIQKSSMYNAIMSAVIILIIMLFFSLKMYQKNKRVILDCRHSLILLPDDLLITNPYIGKFFGSNLRV